MLADSFFALCSVIFASVIRAERHEQRDFGHFSNGIESRRRVRDALHMNIISGERFV